jgi:hypothetical protein
LKEELFHSSVVERIVHSEEIVRGKLMKFKATVLLNDGTQLRVSEIFINNALVKYSYYWLTSENSLIRGWDNAPHHKEVATFPHHSHSLSKVEETNVRSLKQVLHYIESLLQ